MTGILKQVEETLAHIKARSPLVHHITNYVTVNDCANITLAIGASPVMADDIGEVREITAISQALVLNMGTLNERTVASMLVAAKKANELNIPVVFDPVGAGASALRNETLAKILGQAKISIIRGNISEIGYIAGSRAAVKGVDASEKDMKAGAHNAAGIAKALAEKTGSIIAITGATDIISDGSRTVRIENGHKMLGSITGTGCMCTSLIGSACGASEDSFAAAVSGIVFMGIAGEMAFEKAGQLGNGSFRAALIDEISRLDAATLSKRAKITEDSD